MPIVRTTLIEGFATAAQKGEVVRKTTDVIAEVFGEMSRPYVFSLVEEVRPGAWSIGGLVLTDEMERNGIMLSEQFRQHRLDESRVVAAYDALGTGDAAAIDEYWDPAMTWLVPGAAPISGLKRGRDAFLKFMKTVGDLSGNSFQMERQGILVSGDLSADITHNTGTRAHDQNRRLEIDVVHVLRWRDGKVVEGRGAIFGSGTQQYTDFWS
jgi:ketosteroid isomerase-like protein/phenylpyruvate tautomerase PptA (4-oxalocrotonate tautomerase family)